MRNRKLLLSLAAGFLLVLLLAGAWLWREADRAAEHLNAFYFGGEAPADGSAQEGSDFHEVILLWLRDEPTFRIARMLEQPWDLACFVPPYYDLERHPKLAGLSIPWIANDGFNTLVVRRAGVDEIHEMSRSDIRRFDLIGLAPGEICYESTGLSLHPSNSEGALVIGVMPEV
ncbi:MAG: hypothetical protein ACM35H_14880 [Bacteroidota bacterium]|nr:hypothetical protein [Kiloniellaceae bacterium]